MGGFEFSTLLLLSNTFGISGVELPDLYFFVGFGVEILDFERLDIPIEDRFLLLFMLL
jgi:hypothetical protein